jgi:ParB-like nuclease domain
MLIRIRDILPNPYRNIDHYPILRPKVDALKASFEKTEYWDNLLGRLNDKGQFELSYGHHRRVALLEHFKDEPNRKVEVIVKKLSDAEMIQIMAAENMEQWGTSAIVEIETVEAVVKAYAAGKIQLGKLSPTTHKEALRYAPSFIPNKDDRSVATKPYTSLMIGEFLGWVSKDPKSKDGIRSSEKVRIALTALQYMEEGLVELSDFADMTSSGINAVITEARQARSYKESRAKQAEELAEMHRREAEQLKKAEERARARKEDELAREKAAERAEAIRAEALKRHEARQFHKEGQKVASKVSKAVSAHLRSGGGVKTAFDVAVKAAPIHERKGPPNIELYLQKALSEIWDFCVEDKHAEKLNRVLEFKDELDEHVLRNAERTLLDVRDRMQRWAEQFAPGKPAELQGKNGRLQLKR